jgi:hypothetical protein
MKHNKTKKKWKLPSFSLRSETKAKFFFAFSLVFASEAKRKWNEATTKRKRSKNCKAKKDKVKSGTIYKETKKNIKVVF